ncbi:phage tail length tape measure family protein [Stenotrophomonas sp.]|uniref:phage tail length tape measure family protein n=1 Tax=Stenotrophomonas sp. TaxID=69392 RepID=UPI0028AC5E0F|nr:phage tail length tape measure family protein [Stenotrophomonas sp.]
MDLATLGIKVQTEGVAEAATSLDKLDKSGQSAAKTAEKLAPALDKAGTAAGKSSKGTGDAAASMAKLDKASDGAAKAAAKLTPAMQQTAMSAGALANATRQLPMQFTDIFTGLLTGQPIMQVALQQGGQLKDTWGGIGPALKASAAYVWGLVNPFTAAAAAIGLTAYAAIDAAKSMEELAIAVAKGGAVAGTAEQMYALADALNELDNITLGTAEAAVARLASGGKLAGDNFNLAAEASARWSALTGEGVDDVAAKFEAIAKDPLAAIESGQIRVTQAHREQIVALVEVGDRQGAVNKLTKEYYDQVNANSAMVEAHLAGTSRYWALVSDNIGEATRNLGDFVNGLANYAVRYEKTYQRLVAGGTSGFIAQMKAFNTDADFTDVVSRVLGKSSATYDPQEGSAEKERTESLERWLSTADKAAGRQLTLNRLREEGKRLKQDEATINAVIARQEAEWAKQDQASAGRTRKKAKELTEEEKQAKALTSAYDSLSKSMDRRLFMLEHGSTEAAATQYAFERGELKGLTDDLAKSMTYIDNLGTARPFESAADALERMRNTAKAIDAEADFSALYEGGSKITTVMKDATDSMSVFGEQAARNMQDSFADFLFDPFKDGVSGMVENFGKAIQRMLADAAAAKIFEAVGTWASSYQGKGAGLINAISGMITKKNANGGVYDSPSLSAYSGKVYDSPQYFAFAKGAGVFGEAGPEAIMPLKRGSDGRLGVAASGGGAQQIKIEVENKGQPVQAQASAQRQPDGSTLIKMVLDSVADDMASGGKTAQAMQSRFNVSERV